MKYFSVFLLFLSVQLNGANCTAKGNGDWNNAANWDCGHVPVSGDVITIKVGTTVTISTQIGNPTALNNLTINLDGTLDFVTQVELTLMLTQKLY